MIEQIIRTPSEELLKRLESQRNWVRDHYDLDTIKNYETINGKLKVIDTIIKSNWINNHETIKFQCLGVALGDVIVQDLDFNWVEVEDEYGVDPAVKFGETSLILFPLTMISKRIERNETVDIYELYDSLKSKILELRDEVE